MDAIDMMSEDFASSPKRTEDITEGMSDDSEEEARIHRKSKRNVFLVSVFLAILTLALVVVLAVVLTKDENKATASSMQSSTVHPIPQTSAPVNNNLPTTTTTSPNQSSSGNLDLLMQNLPAFTLELLNDESSPQSKAKNWLINHPDLPTMSESRKMQLFGLASFYHAMHGPTWPAKFQDTWMRHDKHECDWHFEKVDCYVEAEADAEQHCNDIAACNDNREIIAISLRGLGLTDHFHSIHVPAEVYHCLPSMERFSLIGNSINATIEQFLPDDIFRLPYLIELNLRNNYLVGNIPTQLGWMSNLQFFSLAGNWLSGSLPTEMGQMASAKEVYLWHNRLSGSIPSEFGLLTNMEDMELLGNVLTGKIPTELTRMTNAQMLHMQMNLFTGHIPSEFGTMPRLTSLSLRQNSLTGTIPSQLAGLSGLKVLRLEHNDLTGSIPEEFNALAADLVRITMNGNRLIGMVPEELCSLGVYDPVNRTGLAIDFFGTEHTVCGCNWCPCYDHLEIFMQSLPSFTLELLNDESSPQHKARIWLSNHPDLPTMSESRKMQLFGLATFYHAMQGPTWPAMFQDTWMRHDKHECDWFFEKRDCYVEEEDVDAEQHCNTLTSCNDNREITAISLRGLGLTDHFHSLHVPPEVHHCLPSLERFSLIGNSINATMQQLLPDEIFRLPYLIELNLRNNYLVGNIPSQLGWMSHLQYLALGGNWLSGHMPTEMGQMASAKEVYLWHNRLSGSIPTEFGLLTSMEDMELLGNVFTGKIPTELTQMTNTQTLHMQMNKFSGHIPSEFGTMPRLTSLSLRQNILTGTIPSQLADLSGLQVLRLENNDLTGRIPQEFNALASHLVRITMNGNRLSGMVPEELCSLGAYDSVNRTGLGIDMYGTEHTVCGCNWCPCDVAANTSHLRGRNLAAGP